MTLAAWDGPVIVPMTLVNPATSPRSSAACETMASRSLTSLCSPSGDRARRLSRRSSAPRSSGAVGRSSTQREPSAPSRAESPGIIHTDHQTVAQVADAIASSTGWPSCRSTDGPLRASLRRYGDNRSHIRFD